MKEGIEGAQESRQLSRAYLLGVSRGGPFAILDHLLDCLCDLWSGSSDVLGGEVFERSCGLDVLECGLQSLEFLVDFLSCLLSGGDLNVIEKPNQHVERS